MLLNDTKMRWGAKENSVLVKHFEEEIKQGKPEIDIDVSNLEIIWKTLFSDRPRHLVIQNIRRKAEIFNKQLKAKLPSEEGM